MKNILQIGCFDGNDHVFERLSTEHFDSALLVDASERALEVAKTQYKDIDNISFLQSAVITGEQKEISFFEVNDVELHGCSSVFREHLKGHREWMIVEIVVPSTNINDLIKYSGFKEIDALYIDAEGVDCLLVLDLDLDLVPINTIVFEYVHGGGVRSGVTELSERCCAKLEKNGFTVDTDPSELWNLIARK